MGRNHVPDHVPEMMKHDFRFQATICEKSKAQPQTRTSKARFYKYPWFYHFRHSLAPHLHKGGRLLVTAASIGAKKERATYTNALNDVVQQCGPTIPWAVDFRPSMTDCLLQAADYCAWSVQRHWERQDSQWLDVIRPPHELRIRTLGARHQHYY